MRWPSWKASRSAYCSPRDIDVSPTRSRQASKAGGGRPAVVLARCPARTVDVERFTECAPRGRYALSRDPDATSHRSRSRPEASPPVAPKLPPGSSWTW
jgi:hypothetical protein